MGKRGLAVALVVAVLAVAWWWLRRRGPAASVPEPAAARSQAAELGGGGPTPSLPAPGGAPSTRAGRPLVVDRTSGGMSEQPPPVPPSEADDTASLTTGTALKLLEVTTGPVAACAKALPAGAVAGKAGLKISYVTDTVDGQLTVTALSAGAFGIAEGSHEALSACLRKSLVGTTVPAPGEPDVKDFPIHVPYRL